MQGIHEMKLMIWASTFLFHGDILFLQMSLGTTMYLMMKMKKTRMIDIPVSIFPLTQEMKRRKILVYWYDLQILESFWDRRIVPDNEFYDSDEGEAQGTTKNLSSRHYQNYGRTDEDEGNKVNGKANHARASSSPGAEDKMDVDDQPVVTQEEEQEIHEVLMAEAVKSEPNDAASTNPEEQTKEQEQTSSTDVVMKEESEQGK